MQFNPFVDPFVEAGYFGYAVRCVAHRRFERRFQPSVEIRDYREGESVLLYECFINQLFSNPDAAIQSGMREGWKFVDEIMATNCVEKEIFV